MSEKKEAKAKVDPASCPLSGCAHHGSCAIIDITNKVPKPGGKCSYYETDKESQSRKRSNKKGANDDDA